MFDPKLINWGACGVSRPYTSLAASKSKLSASTARRRPRNGSPTKRARHGSRREATYTDLAKRRSGTSRCGYKSASIDYIAIAACGSMRPVTRAYISPLQCFLRDIEAHWVFPSNKQSKPAPRVRRKQAFFHRSRFGVLQHLRDRALQLRLEVLARLSAQPAPLALADPDRLLVPSVRRVPLLPVRPALPLDLVGLVGPNRRKAADPAIQHPKVLLSLVPPPSTLAVSSAGFSSRVH